MSKVNIGAELEVILQSRRKIAFENYCAEILQVMRQTNSFAPKGITISSVTLHAKIWGPGWDGIGTLAAMHNLTKQNKIYASHDNGAGTPVVWCLVLHRESVHLADDL